MVEKRKPLIVGLVGSVTTSRHELPRTKEVADIEIARIKTMLKNLPPRSVVGIDMPPEILEAQVRGRFPEMRAEPFGFAAITAQELGHKVIPLVSDRAWESRKRLVDTQEAILAPLARFGSSVYLNPRDSAKVLRLQKKMFVQHHLRSLDVGKKILDEKPQIAFVEETSVREIKPALSATHDFEPSPILKGRHLTPKEPVLALQHARLQVRITQELQRRLAR